MFNSLIHFETSKANCIIIFAASVSKGLLNAVILPKMRMTVSSSWLFETQMEGIGRSVQM